MLKSALLVTAGIIVGAGALQALKAAEGPGIYTVYEANIQDEAAYTAGAAGSRKVHQRKWRHACRWWTQ